MTENKQSKYHQLYRGNMDIECPNTSKIVRIFTSSTFTDTKQERNNLMERVYPGLKQYCQECGYEFQVVDMRWGVRDEAMNDHMTTDLCMKELKLCQKLSTGPSFVTFLSHKFGYRPIPRLIPSDEFENMLTSIKDEKTVALLTKWYKKDYNTIPPTHVLHPISDHIPDFVSPNREDKKAAQNQWWGEHEQIQDALIDAAKRVLPDDIVQRYEMSVTEMEISIGILEADDPDKHTYWFKRNFIDIDKTEPSGILSKYKECLGDKDDVEEAQQLLEQLKEEKLPSALPDEQVLPYDIHWHEKGVSPTDCDEHKDYIEKLCNDFEVKMKEMVHKGIEARRLEKEDSPDFVEIVEHLTFCQAKCEKFFGREATLSKIKNYIVGTSNEPLVLYGESGCGKTSIMASAAKSTLKWCDMKAVVMIRFIGTTPDSSSLVPILRCLIKQMNVCYDNEEEKPPYNIKELLPEFFDALKNASEDKPLVLFLDSLDQFDPIGGVRQLKWLPKNLPPFVKIIVSTLPGDIYEFHPLLKLMLKETHSFLEVPRLPENDVNGILDCCLSFAKRNLIQAQRQIVLDAFQKCPLPLFLKLSFDEACRWTSFTPLCQSILQDTVKDSIETLFCRLEVLHGQTLVSRALGYLTVSRCGLSESELEDILSCDEDVLNDVYMYWTPPIRRLPPLLLVRIKTDLEEYLVDRGADNIQVFTWYHRQFHEKARERYCSDGKKTQLLHANVADFFSGRWSNGNCKPYRDKEGDDCTGDRHVSTQPLMFGQHYNLRKLNNQVYHRAMAKQLVEVKKECLLNCEFLLAKLKATRLRAILDDFELVKSCISEDDVDLEVVSDALRLSEKALYYDPDQLLPQMVNRFTEPEILIIRAFGPRGQDKLRGQHSMKQRWEPLWKECKSAGNIVPSDFITQCFEQTTLMKKFHKLGDFLTKYISSPTVYLEADCQIQETPGGQLVYCLSDHTGFPTALILNQDGTMAITGSADNTIKTWSVKQGRLLLSVDTPGCVHSNHLSYNETVIVSVIYNHGVFGYHIKTGQTLWEMPMNTEAVVCVPPEKDKFAFIFTESRVLIVDGFTGNILAECTVPKDLNFKGFGDRSKLTGIRNFIIVTDNERQEMILFDTNKEVFDSSKVFRLLKNSDENIETVETLDEVEMTPGEKHVILASMQRKDLIVVNIDSFSIEKSIQGKEKYLSRKEFHMTPDGKYLYFVNYKTVVRYNLEDGSREEVMENNVWMNDIATVDGNTYVSIGYDLTVRIWNVTRNLTDSKNMENQKGFEDVDLIKDVIVLDNPRYVLLDIQHKGPKGEKRRGYLLYDVVMREVIRKIYLDQRVYVVPIDSTRLIGVANRKLKVIDVITGKLTMTFQGKMPEECYYLDYIRYLPNKKELITASRGRMNLKIYDAETGKVKLIMSGGHEERIKCLKVNGTETIACASRMWGPISIFDLRAHSLIRTMEASIIGVESFDDYFGVIVTDDEKIIITETLRPPCAKAEETLEVNYPIKLDIHGKEDPVHMIDREDYDNAVNVKGIYKKESETNLGVDKLRVLDSERVIATHHDFAVRIFDMKYGKRLHKTTGHISYVSLELSINCPYVLSLSTSIQENAFRLWDKHTYQDKASFTFDFRINRFRYSKDGKYIMTAMEMPAILIVWKLHASDILPGPQESYPILYTDKGIKLDISFTQANDEDEDPDDPDRDDDESKATKTEKDGTPENDGGTSAKINNQGPAGSDNNQQKNNDTKQSNSMPVGNDSNNTEHQDSDTVKSKTEAADENTNTQEKTEVNPRRFGEMCL